MSFGLVFCFPKELIVSLRSCVGGICDYEVKSSKIPLNINRLDVLKVTTFEVILNEFG